MSRDRELPPPLEMLCLNALWDIGEGNVEDVRRVVSQDRPLAYTTVLTLLDRLARRSAVSRRKEGRGFRYQPIVERSRLRRMALRHFLECHFDGSEAKLKLFLEERVMEEPVMEEPVNDAPAALAPEPVRSAPDAEPEIPETLADAATAAE